MKKLSALLLLSISLSFCSTSEDYKKVRTEVLAVHDSVMMDTELAMRREHFLDTLANKLDSVKKVRPELDTLAEKQQITALKTKLNDAGTQMENWMHNFDADLGKKTNEEALTYFKAEKKKIEALDSLYKRTLKESDVYLSKFR